jgi:hypothetical protein
MKPGSTARTAALAAALLACSLPGCRQAAREAEIAAQKEAARMLAERTAKQAEKVAAEQAAHAAAVEAERKAVQAAESEAARPGLVAKARDELVDRGLGAGVDAGYDQILPDDEDRKEKARQRVAR